MSISFQKTIRWPSGAGEYALSTAENSATLTTPDGARLTMPQNEWANLRSAIDEISRPQPKPRSTKDLPPAQGLAWRPEDDAKLKSLWTEIKSVPALAEHFQRTNGSIVSRLRKHGIDPYPNRKNAEAHPDQETPSEIG